MSPVPGKGSHLCETTQLVLVPDVLCFACRGQEPSTAPALDFSWMAVLWQQAFGHNNPQVSSFTSQSLYDAQVRMTCDSCAAGAKAGC